MYYGTFSASGCLDMSPFDMMRTRVDKSGKLIKFLCVSYPHDELNIVRKKVR
jgi:hypothetical protein